VLILVGGDTAVHVMGELGIQRLAVVRELLPGMPLTYARDALEHPHFIVLKAGNHGDEQTLVELRRFLHARQRGKIYEYMSYQLIPGEILAGFHSGRAQAKRKS
jgi:hypothetical protein